VRSHLQPQPYAGRAGLQPPEFDIAPIDAGDRDLIPFIARGLVSHQDARLASSSHEVTLSLRTGPRLLDDALRRQHR
jgi:hypothetical protein